MDIINKHYEKLILVICLILMVLGLLKVGGLVREANDEMERDLSSNVRSINESAGDMVDNFDPKLFVSKEEWIQRVKTDKPMKVRRISEIVDQSVVKGKDGKGADKKAVAIDADSIISQWDRRYFNVLTRHSRKPIEEAEANYRLDKNQRELIVLKEDIKKCLESISKRVAEVGDSEEDSRLAELRMQLDGFQVLLANTEMDILDLKKRVSYIGMFCTDQGSLVDPQEIVTCPNPDCGSLILSKADVCPFCGLAMPSVNPAEDEGKDSDLDGMPDVFERAHIRKKGFLDPAIQEQLGMSSRDGRDTTMGAPARTLGGIRGQALSSTETDSKALVLDPFNAADAHMDFDQDTFTNLEEYRFGTDIDDPNSYPEPASYVRLIKFDQDKFPVRFMGINESRATPEQKAMKWRAKFSFMLNYKYVADSNRIGVREYWQNNEEAWEQVRMGKRFEAPDMKTYVVDDMGYEEVNGKKRAYVKISEYIPPRRGRRLARRGEAKEEEKPVEAVKYTLYEGEDGFYPDWYAHLIYLPTRSYNALPAVYNNSYQIASGAKGYLLKTRFKLKSGDTMEVKVPKVDEKKLAQEEQRNTQQSRLEQNFDGGGQFGNPNLNGRFQYGGGQQDGRGGDWTASPEVEFKTFKYTVGKFDREKKTLIMSWGEGKNAKTFEVPLFKENEQFTLPDGKKYHLFYEGGEGGANRYMGDDLMNQRY